MTKEFEKTMLSLLEAEFDVKETYQVISHNKMMFWSWGAASFRNINNRGLLFKVSGHHHKGYVLITLCGNDTYSVHIVSTHGNLKESFREVYFEDLQDTIDARIERIAAYSH